MSLDIELRNDPKTPTKSVKMSSRKLVPQSPIPLFISPKKQVELNFACLPCLVEDIVLAALLHDDPACFFRSIPLVCRGWLRAYQSPTLYCGGIDMRWLDALESQQQPNVLKMKQLLLQRPSPKSTVSSLSIRSPTENLLHTLKRRDRLRLLRTVIFPEGLPVQTVDSALDVLSTHCKVLERVDLNQSSASDDGIKKLVEGCGSTLTHLNLASRKPGLTNFALFAVAAHATHLRAMDASAMVGINATGVKWIVEGLGGRSLRELRLSHCPYVGGSVASCIANQAPSLKVLRMEGVILTAQQFQQLVWKTVPDQAAGRRTGSGQLSPLLASGCLECVGLDGHDTVERRDILALLKASPRLQHLHLGKGLSLDERCLLQLASSSSSKPAEAQPLVKRYAAPSSRAPNQRFVATDENVEEQSKAAATLAYSKPGDNGCCPRLQCLSFRPAVDVSPSCLRDRVQQIANSCCQLRSITVRHQGGGRRSLTFFPTTQAKPGAKVRLPEANQTAFPINCTH